MMVSISPLARSRPSGGEASTTVGANRCGGGTESSRPLAVAHSSMVSSSRPSLRSASSHLLRNDPENWARPPLMPASRPTSFTPMLVSALRSNVARSGEPASCIDGTRRARTMSSTSS